MSNSPLRWLDQVHRHGGPIYVSILEALERAILSGELHPGDRLPSQRAVAESLGVDLTTVTRAYSAARSRGLVDGTVGRGTFVRARSQDDDPGLIDLSMNLPPPPEGLSLSALLRETTSAILERSDASVLMAYHPDFGTVGQRAAGARWLEPCLGQVGLDRLLVSPGAQCALAAVLSTICRPGDAIIAEPLTYPGFIGIARRLGLRVLACPADAEGLIPDALEALCARERSKAIYLVPTMQNPTATTMPVSRRDAIARVASSAGLWIVEDDPYSRLLEGPPPAIASRAPEHTFYIATLAKCLSPGLRIAYMVCPAEWTGRIADALRATALMPPPLMAAVATRWVQEGAAEKLLAAVRAETRARRAIAAAVLPAAAGAAESIHVWLPLPTERASERLRAAGQERGLALVTAEAFAVQPDHATGARISLGGPRQRNVLEKALRSVSELLTDTAPPERMIV